MVNPAIAEKFFELLAEIVHGDEPYTEKLATLLALGDEADKANLEELITWFS
jgi:hypothetical protein